MSTKGTMVVNTFERRLVIRPSLTIVCTCVSLLATLLVFALPFAIPVNFHPAISASYVAGFNNRAAALTAAGISVAMAWWSWRRQLLLPRSLSRDTCGNSLGWRLFLSAVLLTCAFTAMSAWAIHKAGLRYIADAGYFIEQMSNHAEYGRALYTQLEFAYGPLLYYPTVWLQELLRCSMFTAYFLTLAAEQSLGLLELACILNTLPVRTSLKRIAFVSLALGAINPLFGLNYTLFRYLTPVSLLIVIAKIKRPYLAAAALAICQAISFGLSAEVGIGFAAGAVAFVVYKARVTNFSWVVALAGPVLGTIFFSATVGSSYFHMLGAFAGGALNLPVAPYPHLTIILFCIVWMAPLAVGRWISVGNGASDAIVICYSFGIAMLPSILGRCDPLHVFFAGTPFCLLSLAGLSTAKVWWRRAWVSCLLILVLWQVGITNKLFRFRTADTIGRVLPARDATALANVTVSDSDLGEHLAPPDEAPYQLDIHRLEETVGAAQVVTPFEITPQDEFALKQSHHFESSYYAFMVDTFSAGAERAKIDEMNQAEWALVPAVYDLPFIETPRNLQDLQGFSFSFPLRHPIPFAAGKAMAENLRGNWKTIDEIGPYRLLKRKFP